MYNTIEHWHLAVMSSVDTWQTLTSRHLLAPGKNWHLVICWHLVNTDISSSVGTWQKLTSHCHVIWWHLAKTDILLSCLLLTPGKNWLLTVMSSDDTWQKLTFCCHVFCWHLANTDILLSSVGTWQKLTSYCHVVFWHLTKRFHVINIQQRRDFLYALHPQYMSSYT